MWLAGEGTTEIFEKFCIEWDRMCSITIACEQSSRCRSSPIQGAALFLSAATQPLQAAVGILRFEVFLEPRVGARVG